MTPALSSATSSISSVFSSLQSDSSSPQTTQVASTSTSSPLTNVFTSLFTLTTSLLSLLASLIHFSTITLPTFFFSILHYSFTFRLTFPSILLLFFIGIITLLVWLRYRHLNRYERLREVPLEKDMGFNLDPDVQIDGTDGNGKEGFHSYLDEFLQAIRIFGYLEKPVFHELARHLQTRRLIAGDSLSLDSDFSFYIVIDGNVQVFAPLPGNNQAQDQQDQIDQQGRRQSQTPAGNLNLSEDPEEDEYNGFQLINEVGSGGTLSSLFTILSLFTEEVQLSKDSGEDSDQPQSQQPSGHVHPRNMSNPSSQGSRSRSNAPHSSSSQNGISVFTPLTHSPSLASSSFKLNAASLRNVPNAVGSEGALERLSGFSPNLTASSGVNIRERQAGEDNQTSSYESETEGSNTVLDSNEHSFSERNGNMTPLEGQFAEALGLNQHSANPSFGEQGNPIGSQDLPSTPGSAEDFRMPPARASAPFPHFSASNKTPVTSPIRGSTAASATSGRGGGNGISVGVGGINPGFLGSNVQYPSNGTIPSQAQSQSQFSYQTPGKPTDSLHPSATGTIARATTDTTLAVIPAEAFKRLTKKFPNAAAHIVQVILTRLSRVTLHTAHEYLGLTKEVIKTEKNLNINARFGLERSFYELGGMEKLRARFGKNPEVPVLGGGKEAKGTKEEEQDYFKNGRDGYLDSEDGPSNDRIRRRRKGKLDRDLTITEINSRDFSSSRGNSTSTSASTSASASPTNNVFASSIANKRLPSNWGNSGTDLSIKTPRARTSVGPGDLLSMTGNETSRSSSGSSFNTATLKTPRPKSKVVNPFSMNSSSSSLGKGFQERKSGNIGEDDIREEEFLEGEDEDDGDGGFGNQKKKDDWTSALGIENFDLRDSVMNCIARSIGLLAAPANGSSNPNNNGTSGRGGGSSVHASPYMNPSDALLSRSVFNSAFSSLSMLDVQNFGNSNGGDDESSSGVTNNTGNNSEWNGVNFLEKLENEVEIKFFKQGEVLVNEGQSGEGLFYVIDGFLDVVVPIKDDPLKKKENLNASRDSKNKKGGNSNQRKSTFNLHQDDDEEEETRSSQGLRGFDGDGRRTRKGSSSTRMSNQTRKKDSNGRLSPISIAPSQRLGNALDGTRPAKASSNVNSSSDTNGFNPVNSTYSSMNNRNRFNSRTGEDQTSSAGPNPRFRNARGDSQAPPPHLDEKVNSNNSGSKSDRSGSNSNSTPVYSIGRGGIAGYLSSLLGKASYVEVRAKTDCYVGVLPAHALERMMERRPIVLLTLCKRLLSLLSPLILHIDSALDWQQVNAGQVIYREGEPSDSFYIVITGRLRAITEKKNNANGSSGGGVEVLAEYGMGDSVGELDVITNEPRGKTLHAIRDSELARMPMTLFNAISVRHPAITIQISRIIARRLREEMQNLSRPGLAHAAPIPGLPDLGRNNLNLKTVAILPVTREVPVSDFATRLQTALEETIGGPTAFLNQSSVMSVLGKHAFNRMGKLKLAGWLAEQEQKYRLVLYVVDTAVSSPWSQTSIRQADCVLLVGFGDDPAMGEYERLLLSIKTTARKELVLLHPERSVPPGSTREWLKTRPWIQAHHHVEMSGIDRAHSSPISVDPKAVKALRTLKEKLETSFQRYKGRHTTVVPGRPQHFSDFARLARRLRGKSVGLVLGGGGARGCAHIGVLRALEERGIPIDMVGGTSIGSLIGGLYAKEAELVSTLGRAKKFSGRMASLWRFASDLTYPVVSYTTGHEFNRGIFKAFSDTHIEDMWLPFFANSVNITWSRMEVHTTGYAWRYIRASMTLAGLIPPLVDDGQMLVDGGYVDNLPVSVMLAMGARDVFAVDVGSIDDTSPRSYGDTLSGWWVLINKWNPWSDARNIPSIPDIQGRLTYVSSVKTLEEAKKTPGCFYMRMPVEGYGTLEFGKFTEIAQIGYEAGSRMLDEWSAQGRLPTGTDDMDLDGEMAKRRRKAGISARRNSV